MLCRAKPGQAVSGWEEALTWPAWPSTLQSMPAPRQRSEARRPHQRLQKQNMGSSDERQKAGHEPAGQLAGRFFLTCTGWAAKLNSLAASTCNHCFAIP